MFQLCGGTFHHLILGTYLLHGGHPVRRDAHADCAAADPGPDVARLERRLHRPLELRGRVDGGHPDDEAEGGRQRHRHHSFPDLIGSLKLGNVRVFVQPIFGPRWPVNQLYKTQTLPNLRLLYLCTLDINDERIVARARLRIIVASSSLSTFTLFLFSYFVVLGTLKPLSLICQ